MKLIKNKKGFSIADIPWLVITFGVGVIAASIVASIIGGVSSTQCTSGTYDEGDCRVCPTTGNCANGCTYNATGNECYNASGTTGISALSDRGIGFNISTAGSGGVTKLANWFTTIGLVIGAVIVITALGALFMFKREGQ